MITGEVRSLLDNKVIHLAESRGGFVSNIFTVPKSSGKVWLILNLKSLNIILEYEHFKMEDIRCVKDLLSRNDFMCLRDAYLTVPITFFLLEIFFGTIGRAYTAQPTNSPQVVHETFEASLIGYLDDFLIMGKTKQEAEGAYMRMKSLLESLGFIVNAEKSLPIATQRIGFLGFIIDSARMEISLPALKMKDIRSDCRRLLRDKVTTVHKMTRLVGMLVATNLAVLPAPLHYRIPYQTDLFALRLTTRLTTELPKYFSWKKDPCSVATNALD